MKMIPMTIATAQPDSAPTHTAAGEWLSGGHPQPCWYVRDASIIASVCPFKIPHIGHAEPYPAWAQQKQPLRLDHVPLACALPTRRTACCAAPARWTHSPHFLSLLSFSLVQSWSMILIIIAASRASRNIMNSAATLHCRATGE